MTRESTSLPMPGDEVVPGAGLVMDRRLVLEGSPAEVWPWLEQLGKRRGGWYLPRAVERLVPRSRRALRRIDPAYVGLRVGDEIPDWGTGEPTFVVVEIVREQHLVYSSERPRRNRRGRERPTVVFSWALALSPLGEDRSELRLRLRGDLGHPPGPLVRLGGGTMDLATIALLGSGLNERLREARAGSAT